MNKSIKTFIISSLFLFCGCNSNQFEEINTTQIDNIEIEKSNQNQIVFYIDDNINYPMLVKEGIKWVSKRYSGCFDVKFVDSKEDGVIHIKNQSDYNVDYDSSKMGGGWTEENIGEDLNIYSYIIAHEFIHMLTGTGLHEDIGIMKPSVDRNDSIDNTFIGPVSQRDIVMNWCHDVTGFQGLKR